MRKLDQGILLTVFTLLGIGLVQVYSASYIFAIETRGDGLYFFKRQFLFAMLAGCALLVTAKLPWRWIEKSTIFIWTAGVGLLLMTLVPGFGVMAGGARRWLHLGPVVFEPSEFIKICLPLMMASYLSQRSSLGPKSHIAYILAIALPILVLLKQPDFGSFVICVSVAFALLFCFGLRWRWIFTGAVTSLAGFFFLIWNAPYRRARLEAFLNPWRNPTHNGFQVIQSMMSFHSGGFFGRGLGQGQGKLFFLPEAHTDFTLAVLGEETGFLGFAIVMALFGYLLFRGFQIAFQTEDRFQKISALGLTVVLALGILINVGVTLGVLPTKGLTLPFLSYGGTSLIFTCALVGLLLNVEAQNRSRRSRSKSGG